MAIYEPALANWRQLRSLQGKKVILQLRIQFYRKLIESDAYPDWSVTFNPPQNLLNTETSIQATVAFRAEQAKQSMTMLADLQEEESARISREITATMASLRAHYDNPESRGYDISDALNSLATFMQRTKENEQSDLEKKYSTILQAPRAALWMGFPPNVALPNDAI